MKEYLAHKDITDGREQSLIEHLTNVSELSGKFADFFGRSVEGKLCGLIHDIGKYSKEFQERIRGKEIRVDHSTAGAIESIEVLCEPVISMCIAGHHTGLMNVGSRKISYYGDGTFFGRLNADRKKEIADYSAYKNEVILSKPEATFRPSDRRAMFFYTHMLYSCLVDADYLDTESFMSDNLIKRGGYTGLNRLCTQLEQYVRPWLNPVGEINRKRSELLNSLIEQAPRKRGLFTLTVPTGGGKTIASMAYALRHAISNGMRRVIYIIPYVSIIEQTQDVFQEIFGSENVVAHYANANWTADEGETDNRKRLASENWDAPIILTTAVQFFESIFSNRPSACRKLHNIAESVLIFDEAQMMPQQYLTPCLWAISELVKNYRCTALLCTATKPAFGKLFDELLPTHRISELCAQPEEMYEFFRRVNYVDSGTMSVELLCEKLRNHSQVLCVVNTKHTARRIYDLLDEEEIFHLSTSMTPQHRRSVLNKIRQRLTNDQPCKVVSTSLIEAGVDVDFQTVYREYAGLDSIIQSGGRCNREGKRNRQDSNVYYFNLGEKIPQYIQQNLAAFEHVKRNHADISSLSAIDEYFNFLFYTLRDKSAHDIKEIMRNIDERSEYENIANKFNLIESGGYHIIVPQEECKALLDEARMFGINRKILRKLGVFTVDVYQNYFNQLVMQGKAEQLADNVAILLDCDKYDVNTGLKTDLSKMNTLIS